jgi:hypothetical protein
VVDPNGGFDFTDIQPAIDASSPGDVILVHAGTYPGFTMTTGISIAGGPGVNTQDIHVTGVSAGSRAAIASIGFRSLSINGCTKPVLVTESAFAGSSVSGAVIYIVNSTDVRLRSITVTAPSTGFSAGPVAAQFVNSRVEVTGSSLQGWPGANDPTGFGTGGPGSAAVLCDGGSNVHISLSTITGGHGGWSDIQEDFGGHGGNGAAAIVVEFGSTLLMTGRASDLVTGGGMGIGISCDHDGWPGPGLSVDSSSYARVSSVTIQSGGIGVDGCGLHTSPSIVGNADVVTPIDPSLELSGTTSPGQVLTLVVHGTPGDSARIRLGRQAVVHDTPSYEDELTNPLRIYDLGALPASGEATKHVTIPGSLPHGYLMVFQGTTTDTGGVTRLTQSAPVVVH